MKDICERIKITPARREDLYALAALIHDSWRSVYHGIVAQDYLNSMSLELRHERFAQGFDEGASHFYQMLLDELLIGAAVFGKSHTEGFEQDGEISAIYLDKDFIGHGYGHLFFSHVERLLQKEGYAHLVLSLLPENVRAFRFYQAHGYRESANSTLDIGGKSYPVVIMRKQL